MIKNKKNKNKTKVEDEPEEYFRQFFCLENEMEDYMRDYTWRDAMENLAAYLQKESVQTMKNEILKMERDTKKGTADEMMDDLLYLAELIDFMGITACLAVRGTLSERMTDKLTDSIAGLADEVLEKWEDYQDKTE